jgi:hypothetical protein
MWRLPPQFFDHRLAEVGQPLHPVGPGLDILCRGIAQSRLLAFRSICRSSLTGGDIIESTPIVLFDMERSLAARGLPQSATLKLKHPHAA